MRLIDYRASANCYKVRLALHQLGTDCERVEIDIFAGDTLTPEFGRLNPARSTPVLVLDDGRVLTESGAILVWLAEGTPLLSDDPWDRAQAIRWLLYEQADVVPAIGGLRFRLHTGRLHVAEPDAVARLRAGHEALALLDGVLRERPFLVADAYGIADIGLYGYVHVAHEAGYEMDRYPAIGRWLQAVADQPGHVADLRPYPRNAHVGAGRSVYD